MNSTFSTALRAHMAQPDRTTATGWKVTLDSGEVRGFTDLDRTISILGVDYVSTAGYTRTDVSSSSALNVDNGEITGFLRAPAITEDDLRAGIWDGAEVEAFVFNYEDLSMGRGIQRTGTIGRVNVGRDTFTAEVRGLAQKFAYTIGRLYTPGCRHILGDTGCKVDLDAGSPPLWRVTGALEGVSDDGITLFDSARAEAGPSGGFGISVINAGDPSTDVVISDAVPWKVGTPFVISGLTTIPVLNRTWLVQSISFAGGFTHIGIDVATPGGFYGGSPGVAVELGADSGFFQFGTIEFTSGLNAGLSMEIGDYVPGQWTIVLPMPYPLEAGDGYIMTAGCNKQLATCRDKFANVINFGGFPYVPGIDRLMQVGTQ